MKASSFQRNGAPHWNFIRVATAGGGWSKASEVDTPFIRHSWLTSVEIWRHLEALLRLEKRERIVLVVVACDKRRDWRRRQ